MSVKTYEAGLYELELHEASDGGVDVAIYEGRGDTRRPIAGLGFYDMQAAEEWASDWLRSAPERPAGEGSPFSLPALSGRSKAARRAGRRKPAPRRTRPA